MTTSIIYIYIHKKYINIYIYIWPICSHLIEIKALYTPITYTSSLFYRAPQATRRIPWKCSLSVWRTSFLQLFLDILLVKLTKAPAIESVLEAIRCVTEKRKWVFFSRKYKNTQTTCGSSRSIPPENQDDNGKFIIWRCISYLQMVIFHWPVSFRGWG